MKKSFFVLLFFMFVFTAAKQSYSATTMNIHWTPDTGGGTSHGTEVSGNIWINLTEAMDSDPMTSQSISFTEGYIQEQSHNAPQISLSMPSAAPPSCCGTNMMSVSMDPSVVFQLEHNSSYKIYVKARVTGFRMGMPPEPLTPYDVEQTAYVTGNNLLITQAPYYIISWDPATMTGANLSTTTTDAQTGQQQYKYTISGAGGSVEKTFTNQSRPGTHSFTWNGKNILGTLMLKGLYSVKVNVYANTPTTSGDCNRSSYLNISNMTVSCLYTQSSNRRFHINYTLTDMNSISASSGELWFYNPSLSKIHTYSLTGLTASSSGTANQIEVDIPVSDTSAAGNYYFALHISDGRANDYKNHASRPAVDTIVSYSDISPPQITISKPAVNGEYVTGNVFVKAYVADESGIASVKCYVDNVYKGDFYTENDYLRYDWNSSGTSKGQHTIKVEATDSSPNANTGNATRTVFCHPVVSLNQISFQDDHTLWDRSDDDLYPGGTQITEPQWTASLSKPFAYTISESMTSNVRMTSSDVLDTVYIRYTVNGSWYNSLDQLIDAYSVDKDNVYGTFPYWLAHYPTALDIAIAMDYNLYQSFDFFVRKSNNSDWCFAGEGEAGHNNVYLIFDDPIAPWGPAGTPRACWEEVIHDACIWMPEDGYSANQTLDAKKRLAYKAYWSTGKNYDGTNSHYINSVFKMKEFIFDDDWADCQDMSFWWVKLCNSVGLNGQVRQIEGPFNTQSIDPVGTPSWTATLWNFHQTGWYDNIFDPCIQLNQSSPRVPQYENIQIPYKTSLYDTGDWMPQTPFSLTEVD